jgi:hypothetical protein
LGVCLAADHLRHGAGQWNRPASRPVSSAVRLGDLVDRVGLAVFELITVGMQTVFLSGDDTLLSRSGLKVFGTGLHRDAVLSSRSHTVVRWGHCWAVLGVVIESRWVPGRRFALPVLCRLDLNRKSAAKWNRLSCKKTELLLEMLRQLDRPAARSGKRLHFLGDSA